MEEDRYATIPDRDSNDPTDRAFSNPSSMMLGNQQGRGYEAKFY